MGRSAQRALREFGRDPDAAVGRVAAIAAVVLAVVVCGVLLIGLPGDGSYQVKLQLVNAGQLVAGNEVRVAGKAVGSVESIELAPNGQAEVTITVEDDRSPLPGGTRAVVRAPSLSGVANRFVELRYPQHRARTRPIPDGGTIPADRTTSAVDIDQVFSTLDRPTRDDVRTIIRQFSAANRGRGDEINGGLLYLNPALAASSRLFRMLNRDSEELAGFFVESSGLMANVASRREDVAGIVEGLALTMETLERRRADLGASIRMLPDFMREANTTFVNARATLDDVDPLVADAKPVARRLRPLLTSLRPLAIDARPTVRDLARLLAAPGPADDLVDLLRRLPRLRRVAVGPLQARGRARAGALPASADALSQATPLLAFARPYTPDLFGWFDDFSHTGTYDALGAMARGQPVANAFSVQGNTLLPIPPELRAEVFRQQATRGQDNRCPGSADHAADDGSNPWRPTSDFNCDPRQVLPGR
jgi:phospholipid/cholesterol/gamma-HCH transport system substrate-binding protein